MCESESAIDLVQERNRQLLKALSRERNDLYQQIGASVTARQEALLKRDAAPMPRKRSASAGKTRRTREREKADT
jgi:hypothetical protein